MFHLSGSKGNRKPFKEADKYPFATYVAPYSELCLATEAAVAYYKVIWNPTDVGK